MSRMGKYFGPFTTCNGRELEKTTTFIDASATKRMRGLLAPSTIFPMGLCYEIIWLGILSDHIEKGTKVGSTDDSATKKNQRARTRDET